MEEEVVVKCNLSVALLVALVEEETVVVIQPIALPEHLRRLAVVEVLEYIVLVIIIVDNGGSGYVATRYYTT